MAQKKPIGSQLDIQDIANDIGNNPTASASIASGVTADLDAEYLRIAAGSGSPLTNTMLIDLDLGGNHITNVGLVDGQNVSSHVGDDAIHFNEASIDHTAITNRGTNTHVQIDTHIDSTPTVHRIINDSGTTTIELFSASKIIADLAAHGHAVGDLTDVTLTGSPQPATDDILRFNGTAWTNATFATLVTSELSNNSLNSLSDVDYSAGGSPMLTTNDVLAWNGTSWIPTAGFSVTDFIDLADAPSSYSSDGSQFVMVNPGETGLEFIPATLDNLFDVTLTGSPLPATNDVLVYGGSPLGWSQGQVVNSFEGRTGVVVATAGDYLASEITYVPSGSPEGISSTDVQAALDELDTEKATTGHTHAIDDTTDVTVTALDAGEVLFSSGSPAGWINATLAEAGISATGHTHAIDDTTDVTVTSLTDGEILVASGSPLTWINQTLAEANVSATGHSHTASDVTDFATEVTTQLGSNDLGTLGDVTLTSLTNNEVLVASGSPLTWVNAAIANTVFGRTGTVVATAGDYNATEVTYTPTGSPEGISAITAAAAIDELDTEKAPKASPVFTGVPELPSYTVGTLPTVVQGGMIYVTDAVTGPGSPLDVGVMCFGRTSGSPFTWVDVFTGLPVA